jgi:hypothetical protein
MVNKIQYSNETRSKKIISLFRKDIKNMIIFFAVLISITATILLLQSINNQTILLFGIISLVVVYIVSFEFHFFKRIYFINGYNSLNVKNENIKALFKDWRQKSYRYLVIPSVIVLNCLLLLTANLLKVSFFLSYFWLAFIFSIIFAALLYLWINNKTHQYLKLFSISEKDDDRFEKKFQILKKWAIFTSVIIWLLGTSLLLILINLIMK